MRCPSLLAIIIYIIACRVFVPTYVVQGATFTVVSRKKVGKVLHIELNHEGEWMDLEQSSRVGRKLSGLFSCCGGGGSSGAKSKAKKQAPAHGKGDDPGSKYSEEQTPDGAVVPKVSFDPVVQTDDGNSQLDGGTLTDVAWNRHKDQQANGMLKVRKCLFCVVSSTILKTECLPR